MNITLTGNLGSGKSSVCKELQKFRHEIISAGDIFRSIATERGLTVTELNEQAKQDKSIDDMLDHRTMELDQKKDNVVFDSRLAWHFTKNSFKVFLFVELDEAASRVFQGTARNAETYGSVEETKEGLCKRAQLEQERYKQLYQVDYYDPKNYDLIIESTNATPEEIASEIERNFLEYQKQPFATKIELNLRELYPTKPLEALRQEQLEECKKQEEGLEQLCCMEKVSLVESDGYHFIETGTHQLAGALAAHKAFAEAKAIKKIPDKDSQNLVLQSKDLEAYEALGGFSYRNRPGETKRSGYNIDLKKVFE